MNLDENSFNSMPTVAGGARPLRADIDELSDTTAVGQGIPGAPLGQIDQYQLVRKLGGGGFGVVYLARDTVSGVDVALKTLHPLLKSNPEEMEALRAKFALVSRLSHPNIASPLVLHPCRDIDITDDAARREMRLSPGDSVMVMRYAPGVTLSKWRRQFPDGVVPLDQALEVVRQVASALDYAHGEKIVHRDIKPANIMVETLDGCGKSHTEAQRHRDGGARIRVRILDFGLAAEIRSSMSRISTETGDTSGTRPYMAPEQWLGRKQDGRTDQYALACVAYEMLSGAPPFAGVFETGDPIIMRTAIERDAPEEIEGVPAHVNAALMRALSKNPKERFGSCAEFVDALSSTTKDTKYSKEDEERSPSGPQSQIGDPSAISEAEVLRRKVALERAVKAIPSEDRADKELKVLVDELETELVVLDQACRYSRFAAAAESLDRADATLVSIGNVKAARAEVERKTKEEVERKAREERERKVKAEAERRAREEAERKIREEAERREVERRAREEIWRQAKEATAKAAEPKGFYVGLVSAFLFLVAVIGYAMWRNAESPAPVFVSAPAPVRKTFTAEELGRFSQFQGIEFGRVIAETPKEGDPIVFGTTTNTVGKVGLDGRIFEVELAEPIYKVFPQVRITLVDTEGGRRISGLTFKRNGEVIKAERAKKVVSKIVSHIEQEYGIDMGDTQTTINDAYFGQRYSDDFIDIRISSVVAPDSTSISFSIESRAVRAMEIVVAK